MTKKEPKNIGELRDELFRRFWRRLKRTNLIVRTFVLVLLALAVVFAARLGLLGETPQKTARVVLPKRIPFFESAQARPSLIVTFDAVHNGVQRAGQNGATYRTGDTIVLHVMPSADAWTLIFGVDARGEHAVIGQHFRAIVLQGDKTHDVRFHLDKTVGRESYFVVAAAEPFSFQRDIRPKLGDGKGPVMQDLPLDDRFAQQTIWFVHVVR